MNRTLHVAFIDPSDRALTSSQYSMSTSQAVSKSAQASQELLRRFYARESRLLGIKLPAPSQPEASTSTSVSTSRYNNTSETRRAALSSTIPALSWTAQSNPFLRQKREEPSPTGRAVWHSARYGARRQRQFAQALNVAGEEGWSLPASRKANAERAKKSKLQQTVEDYLDQYVKTDVRGTQIAYTEGPYKGRQQKPVRLHKWEREAEAVKQARQEKLKAMPSRIADYMKVSDATRYLE